MQHTSRSIINCISRLFLCFLLSGPLFAATEAVHVAPININTASAEALADSLQGVGPSRAQAIVAYREAHGPFQAPEDLVNVKGIGDTTVASNLEKIEIK